jgi:hypothetical protein
VAATGCGGRFRVNQLKGPQTQPTTQAADVWHLPLPASGNWLWERHDLDAEPDAPRSLYVKKVSPGRQIEGGLIARRFPPLADCIRRPGMTPEQTRALPKAPIRAYAAIILELSHPMPYYPAEIRIGQSVYGSAGAGCYDRFGRCFFYGTVERTATAEGYEDVTCPAGEYKQCKRIKIELRFRFPWNTNIDVTEYRWFADGVGEVRRLEHVDCTLWIFSLNATNDYLLVSFFPDATASQAADAPRNWSTIAVIFDRLIPHPRITGAYVELVPWSVQPWATQPTSAPARKPI